MKNFMLCFKYVVFTRIIFSLCVNRRILRDVSKYFNSLFRESILHSTLIYINSLCMHYSPCYVLEQCLSYYRRMFSKVVIQSKRGAK